MSFLSPVTLPVRAVKSGAAEAIVGGVLPGDVLGLGVNVHARGVGRAEQDGSDGQNAAAAAEIEHALAALNSPFQLAHTHLRGRVRAGAEDHAGVEQDLDAVFRVFRVQPLRNDQQPFADGSG